MKSYELICYDTDASRIEGKAARVFHPETEQEIMKIVSSSMEDIVPRGSGTNVVGGCVPNNSIVIDMRNMDKVTNFDPAKQTITVEAGITIKELNEKLKKINKEFPIYFKEQSTIGSIGDKSLRYGIMKDMIEKIDFINGRGELLNIGKADLSEVCGMEGITGIITKAILRIINLREKSLSLFQSDNLEEVLSIAKKLKIEREVVSLKFYSKKVSLLFGFPEKYHIIVGFDSDKGKIKDKDYEKISNIIKKEYYSLYSNDYIESEDAKLFYDKLKEFITFLEDIDVIYTGDLGSSIINPFFKEKETDKKNKTIEIIKKIGAKKGRYGIGLKRKYLIEPLEKKIIQRIKKRHDPFFKFNRNKLIDFPFTGETKDNISKTSITEKIEKSENSSTQQLDIIKEFHEKDNIEISKKPKPDKKEYDLIRDIMTNKYEDKERKNVS